MTAEFWEGFEKEGGLKHWLTAGLMAAAPATAKADDALRTAAKAFQKQYQNHPTVQNVKKHLSFRGGKSTVGLAGAAGDEVAQSAGKVDLKDLSRLEASYGKLHGTVTPSEIKGKFNINDNLSLDAKLKGDERVIGFNFRRDF